MERVWGDDGFGGSWEEYSWLQAHYGITEVDDVHWQMILQQSMGDLEPEDASDEYYGPFLRDEKAIEEFLNDFLRRYRAGTGVYTSANG